MGLLAVLALYAPAFCDEPTEPELVPRKSKLVGTMKATVWPGILIHGSGHRYAENTRNANLMFVSQLVGVGLFFAADYLPYQTNENGTIFYHSWASAASVAGIVLFISSWGWDIIGTPNAVEDWNVAQGWERRDIEYYLGPIGKGLKAASNKLLGPSTEPATAAAPSGLNVAVAEFTSQPAERGDARMVSDWIRGQMVRTGTFTVVERDQMDQVLAEQAFQQTGCTSDECAVKLGRLLNAQRIVVGSYGKFLDEYIVNAGIANVETGQVIYADSIRGKTTDEVVSGLRELSVRLAKNLK